MLEKTPESLLDCREIRPVNSKWNQPWIFIGRIDAKVKALVLWLPDAKSWLLEKTLMLGKIEGKKRRRWDEMVGWHHWLNERQWRTGILQCCSPWVCRVGYDLTTEQQQRVMGSNGRHPIKKNNKWIPRIHYQDHQTDSPWTQICLKVQSSSVT